MTDIITDSFYIIITIFRCAGLYYNGKQSKLMKVWRSFLYFSCVLITVLSFVDLVVERNTDVMQLNQIMVFLIEATAACLKILLFMKNAPKIKRCVDFFGRPQFAPKDDEERRILNESIDLCQRNVKLFVGGLFLIGVYWNILPFFNQESTFPVRIWLPYEINSYSTTFYLTYLYVAIVIIYLAVVTTSLDPLIGCLAYHAATQLKILKYNFTYTCGMNRKEYFGDNETVFTQIRRCVLHYNDILNFVKIYENSFSWCIFCQIAATTFGLCFCSIGLTWVSPTSVNGLIFFVCYVAISFQLFFYCHYGTLLYEENNSVIRAIYMSPWYKYGVRERKMLITVMERSKKPITLSAGKVINLTYETFTSVIKTSYSLIAVLKKD